MMNFDKVDKSRKDEMGMIDMESKELIPFNYDKHQVRVVMIKGEPWWVLKDVCNILEIGNNRDVTARLDGDEKGVDTIDTLGGKQKLTVISESGLYSTILLSRKPQAKAFKRWVTHEVLPQIRKTGSYSVKPRDSYMIEDPVERAKAWIVEEEKRKELVSKINADKPYTDFGKHVTVSNNSIDIGTLAKIAADNGVKIGRNRLFEFLRENKILYRDEGYNVPYQVYIDREWFKVKYVEMVNAYGSKFFPKISVTGAGQVKIVNMLLENFKNKVVNGN